MVYGTLRRGCTNRHARLLDRSARYLGTARVRGKLYKVRWYPGVRLRGGADDWVTGDLFRLRNPAMLAALDRYEGSHEYRRVEATAVRSGGRRVRCWVYEYLGRVKRRIASGDWWKT